MAKFLIGYSSGSERLVYLTKEEFDTFLEAKQAAKDWQLGGVTLHILQCEARVEIYPNGREVHMQLI